MFENRTEAGRFLARKLASYAGRSDVVVLALPRGGVPVGFEVAQALHAPLDIFLVRKLGFPGHEELAMGAIASGGKRVLNRQVLSMYPVPAGDIERVVRIEQRELERREQAYRAGLPPIPIEGRTVILVDDGLATGSTMLVAIAALRQQMPERIVTAVPVGPADTCRKFEAEANEVVCGITPEPFVAVGQWYEDFSQTTDEEVQDLLHQSREMAGASAY